MSAFLQRTVIIFRCNTAINRYFRHILVTVVHVAERKDPDGYALDCIYWSNVRGINSKLESNWNIELSVIIYHVFDSLTV